MRLLDGAAKIKQVRPLNNQRRIDVVFRKLFFLFIVSLIGFRLRGIGIGIVHVTVSFPVSILLPFSIMSHKFITKVVSYI